MSIYGGIDWSEEKHDISFVNEAGAELVRKRIEHSQKGFQELAELCGQLNASPEQCYLALETRHNLLVDYLWSHGYQQVYVVAPSMVQGYRQRYGNSGARTDASDAYVLANALRTDRQRLTLWKPDQPLTRELRATVTQVYQLTRHTQRFANQLRALLIRYYPSVLDVFPDLTTQTPLAFMAKYPTPADAARITTSEFEAFLAEQHYTHRRYALARLRDLQNPRLTTDPATAGAYCNVAATTATLQLVTVKTLVAAKKRLTALFKRHPDHDTFASLPGTGAFLAPALLVKFGDDRERFPTPASVQALAGTCPVTEQSGKYRSVRFRKACDHEFRTFAQQWAKASVERTQSPFACAYFDSLRRRHIPESHAYRCLANRWLAIAWHLWRTHTTYDQAYHLQQRERRSQPASSSQA
jgi:transposase